MSGLLADTSVWVSYFRGESLPSLDKGLKNGVVFLSPVVAAELASGSLSKKMRAQLYDFLETLPMTNADFSHWIKVGELRAKLRAKGFSISTPDAHIACTALENNLQLASDDQIFKKVAPLISLKIIQ